MAYIFSFCAILIEFLRLFAEFSRFFFLFSTVGEFNASEVNGELAPRAVKRLRSDSPHYYELSDDSS